MDESRKNYLREKWRTMGGELHGPVVETAIIPEEKLLPMLDRAEITEKIANWLLGEDTGVSSKAIVMTALGINRRDFFDDFDAPHDAGDFGRCYRLLKSIPQLYECLPKLAKNHKHWRPLVGHWSDLEMIYKRDLPTGKMDVLSKMIRYLRRVGESHLDSSAFSVWADSRASMDIYCIEPSGKSAVPYNFATEFGLSLCDLDGHAFLLTEHGAKITEMEGTGPIDTRAIDLRKQRGSVPRSFDCHLIKLPCALMVSSPGHPDLVVWAKNSILYKVETADQALARQAATHIKTNTEGNESPQPVLRKPRR